MGNTTAVFKKKRALLRLFFLVVVVFSSASLHANLPEAVLQSKSSTVFLVIESGQSSDIQNGVIWNAAGTVLTVAHGLTPGASIGVHTAAGGYYAAEIQRVDLVRDIAFLTPKKPLSFPVIPIAVAKQFPLAKSPAYSLGRLDEDDTVKVEEGKWLMANLHLSYQQLGAKRFKEQGFTTEAGLIHSGNIVPGWSGGAVVNSDGELVALNHALFREHSPVLALATSVIALTDNAHAQDTGTPWLLQGLVKSLIWQGYQPQLIQQWLTQTMQQQLPSKKAWEYMLTQASQYYRAPKLALTNSASPYYSAR